LTRIAKEKSVIQLEGKAHSEETAKTDKVAKSKPKLEKSSPFPTGGEINDYGFLYFRKSWLEDLGWTNGMPLKIEKNADGSITLRKA